MGFFDRFFYSESSEDSIWNSLSGTDEVDELLMLSNEHAQVVFKHSNSCGTSFFAKRNLDAIPPEKTEDVTFYLIDVIRNRRVSLYLSDKLGIRHESPQLFVIRNGEVVWHGSHEMVNSQNLLQALG